MRLVIMLCRYWNPSNSDMGGAGKKKELWCLSAY